MQQYEHVFSCLMGDMRCNNLTDELPQIQRRPPRTSNTAVPAQAYAGSGTDVARTRSNQYPSRHSVGYGEGFADSEGHLSQHACGQKLGAASRPDAARLPSNLQLGEIDDTEVDWSVLTKDSVFQHLMNSREEGADALVGEVKKFVAGRAIVGKELTC